MRLSPEQIDAIKRSTAEVFGPAARVWLFGSRVDDSKRGGDIDLYIELPEGKPDPEQLARAEISFLVRLKAAIGDQRVDLLLDHPARSERPAIFDLARARGVPL